MSSALNTRAALVNPGFQTPPATPRSVTEGASQCQHTATSDHLHSCLPKKRPYSMAGSGPCSPSPSKRQKAYRGATSILQTPPSTPQRPTKGTLRCRLTAAITPHLQDCFSKKRPYPVDTSGSLSPAKRQRMQEVTGPKRTHILRQVGSSPRPLVRQGAIANILWHDFKQKATNRGLVRPKIRPASPFETCSSPSSQARLTTSPTTRCVPFVPTSTPDAALSTHFPLLDLPVELILEIMDRVELTGEVSTFIKSCRSLGRAMAVPYLKRLGAIHFGEHSVDVNLQGTSLGLGAALISYLPTSKFVWLRIGMDTLARYQKELEPFFQEQVIYDLRIQYPGPADSPLPGDILSVVHTTLRSMVSGLDSLTLESMLLHPPAQGPLPSDGPLPLHFGDLGEVRKTLRTLNISAHWSNLAHFSPSLSNFSGIPHLSTLSVFDIPSEEAMDSILSPLQMSSHVQNVYLSTTMNSAIDICPFLPRAPAFPRRLSMISLPDVFDPLSCSTPFCLPAWPSVRFTCNFPSLSAVNACSLSHLTAVPISKYKSPWLAEYCQILELFLRSLECLGNLPISGVDLCLELPWMISTHLAAEVAGCNCRQASRSFKVPGVTTVGFVSNDSSPSAFVSRLSHLETILWY